MISRDEFSTRYGLDLRASNPDATALNGIVSGDLSADAAKRMIIFLPSDIANADESPCNGSPCDGLFTSEDAEVTTAVLGDHGGFHARFDLAYTYTVGSPITSYWVTRQSRVESVGEDTTLPSGNGECDVGYNVFKNSYYIQKVVITNYNVN